MCFCLVFVSGGYTSCAPTHSRLEEADWLLEENNVSLFLLLTLPLSCQCMQHNLTCSSRYREVTLIYYCPSTQRHTCELIMRQLIGTYTRRISEVPGECEAHWF